MYTVKRVTPRGEQVFTNTNMGHENRDFAITQALNMASAEAKERRCQIRATNAYNGYIAFMVENSKVKFGGYAVKTERD